MQRREKILVGGLLIVVVGFLSIGFISSTIFEPFQKGANDIAELNESIRKKEDERLLLSRAQKSLKEFKSICLPPDPGKSKQPSAFNAQRLYVDWLTDLGQLCGFETLKVIPGGTTARDKVYITVVGRVEAEARYEQLVKFLDLFL